MSWSCGFQLRIRSGPNRGNTHVIDAPVLKVGRAIRPGERVPGWLRVNDDTVSRLHCELFWQEDRDCFRLLHRSTTNSTYVNGEIVEDAEVFDGDIVEVGATSLEIQRADLRWSKAKQNSVEEWAPEPVEPAKPRNPEEEFLGGFRKIPGATVPVSQVHAHRRMTIGPTVVHVLETEHGSEYPLKGSKIRFGCSAPPPNPVPEEGADEEATRPIIRFDTEYNFDDQDFSFHNLILAYDELVQSFKIARVGPDARQVRVFRKQSGLVWQTELPEGVELVLMEGDHLQLGELVLGYKKREAL